MNRATDAALGIALAIAALAAIGTPAPRLIGTGCNGAPLGLALAREESSMGRCDTIERLPWITEQPR